MISDLPRGQAADRPEGRESGDLCLGPGQSAAIHNRIPLIIDPTDFDRRLATPPADLLRP